MNPSPAVFRRVLACCVCLYACQTLFSYTITGYKWPQDGGKGAEVELTYGFSNLLDGGFNTVLSNVELRTAVSEAFGLWSAVAPLSFVEVESPSTPVDAMIQIGYRTFDPLYASAIAFYPASIDDAVSGDIFFANNINDPFIWGLNTLYADDPFELDVLEVLVHEIGHSLGLGHEYNINAIMNPTLGNRFSGLGTGYLLEDDIAGIHAIYGERPNPQTVPDSSFRVHFMVILGILFYVRKRVGE